MSLSKGCHWVLPNTHSNFTLPLGMTSWRCDIITSREGVRVEGTVWTDEETIVSYFSSFNLRFFVSMASWGKGSFFIPFTRAYFSLLYLVAILARRGSRKEVSLETSKKKQTKTKRIHKVVKIFNFSSKFYGSLNSTLVTTLQLRTLGDCKTDDKRMITQVK